MKRRKRRRRKRSKKNQNQTSSVITFFFMCSSTVFYYMNYRNISFLTYFDALNFNSCWLNKNLVNISVNHCQHRQWNIGIISNLQVVKLLKNGHFLQKDMDGVYSIVTFDVLLTLLSLTNHLDTMTILF